MPIQLPPKIKIPREIHEGIDWFCNQMQVAFGKQLLSIVLYGGIAKGEYTPFSSNVNLMVILKEISVEQLDKIVWPVQQGRRDFRLALFLVSEQDLKRSTDVFPIKFLDIKEHHHLLIGQDFLNPLVISRENLRLRCEQVLKNLLWRMRHFYIERVHHPELIESTLARAISSFLISLNILLLLQMGYAPIEKKAIAKAAATKLNLDQKLLLDLLALKYGELRPDLADLKRLYNSFMITLEKTAELADQLHLEKTKEIK